jgi:hypothetical protein
LYKILGFALILYDAYSDTEDKTLIAVYEDS